MDGIWNISNLHFIICNYSTSKRGVRSRLFRRGGHLVAGVGTF